ncbi:hypothetical protein GJ496_004312 [Pomphorhynchus laevis]|nr:hypothetical protein GJ496_004312 [Pomphorhynchus laevis]
MKIIASEPNLLSLRSPLTIVGDIHGQFFDLLNILDKCGQPGRHKYLFLGDYIDRGSFGVECLLYLCALKCNYPRHIFLLRGNHECRSLSSHFTFRSECVLKVNLSFYEVSLMLFRALPLASIVDNKLFCVHGCISPSMMQIKHLNSINRFIETPYNGVMCDLLWADPDEPDPNCIGKSSKEERQCLSLRKTLKPDMAFYHNAVRNCSYIVTPQATRSFLLTNDLLCVIRAHQVMQEGYCIHSYDSDFLFPNMITIFSAPNYCDVYGNKGAVLQYNGYTLQIIQFDWVNHPYVLPNFLNALTWSVPFVIRQANKIFLDMLDKSKFLIKSKRSIDASNKGSLLSSRCQPATGKTHKGKSEYRLTKSVSSDQETKWIDDKSQEDVSDPDQYYDTTDVEANSAYSRSSQLQNMLTDVTKQSRKLLKLKGLTPSNLNIFTKSEEIANMPELEGYESIRSIDKTNERWI